MMASLSQTPAQTGLASILAALGQAAPAGTATDTPGFEQLFASLPAAAAAAPAVAPIAANLSGLQTPETGAEALPAPVTPASPTPPAAALFGLPQPVAKAPVDAALPIEPTIKTPAKAAAKPQPADDAAVAASLLIAVATPIKAATPATDKAVAAVGDESAAPTEGETASPAAAATVAAPPQVVETPTAATVIATALPVTEKAAKPVAPAAAHHQADVTSQTQATAKAAEAVQPQPVTPAAVEPKAAKPVIDAGASMAVLFAQPDLQGAAPLLEAAKAAPLAERTLDLTSDDQWIAQLAADIAATKSDKGDISFRLMPRHLGRLDVSMLSGDEGVSLRLDTQHEATATIVQAAQPRLVEDLRQQGVRVADAQVTHTPAEAGRQQQHQSPGRGSAPDASHLIETAADQADPTHDERTADRRGRFA